MIICRLSAILGAKRIKVADLCRSTGIARATLDRYYYDRVNSFDRAVLEKLCKFLQVEPGELLMTVDQEDLFEPWIATGPVTANVTITDPINKKT
jgi:putative transcriptional regulator